MAKLNELKLNLRLNCWLLWRASVYVALGALLGFMLGVIVAP